MDQSRWTKVVVASALALATAETLRREAAIASQPRPTEEKLVELPTPNSPELRATGRKLFLDNCAHCHGADARGDEGPDLHEVQASDRYLANIITHGIPHEMPSFAKKLHGREISALTAYVQSLE